MKQVGVFFCLTKGLKTLYPHLGIVVLFVLFLSAIEQIPVLIARLQGFHGNSVPISLWGFFLCFLSWTTETVAFVGVGQAVWRDPKSKPFEGKCLFPDKEIHQHLFIWALSFTLVVFMLATTAELLTDSVSKGGRSIAIPALPFLFYCTAFIPLTIADRRIPMISATTHLLTNIQGHWGRLVKLALTAQIVFLVVGTSFILLQSFIFSALAISESVIADQAIWAIAEALIRIINAAMMAVAYVEFNGQGQEEDTSRDSNSPQNVGSVRAV
ncbi:MAG: hypothetical protein OEY28_02825 [Nitrospira sp.]|nr:hypothetical protein [Nitrospira sp.]